MNKNLFNIILSLFVAFVLCTVLRVFGITTTTMNFFEVFIGNAIIFFLGDIVALLRQIRDK